MSVIVFTIISMLLDIYILTVFRQLLNRQFEFHLVDDLITYLIIGIIIISMVNISGWVFFGVCDIIKIIVAIMFCPIGILMTLFGYRILKLQDSLFSLLKPYAYLDIAGGICFAAILLAFFRMLIAMISAIIQGLIFIRFSEQVEFV